MNLRTGYTTGACAAAAAKAAAIALCRGDIPEFVEISLPGGERPVFAIVRCTREDSRAEATVQKDAGDDPDVTHQALISSKVSFDDQPGIRFEAGEGVGTVTKPGLSVAPGEPAINPGPRGMIEAALREITDRGVCVRVSIPGGRELAAKTFNPRLGIEGGLSIIGTTGIVKPFSLPAVEASLRCALEVADASGVRLPVLVPGNIGERAARRAFRLASDQVIQVSNLWGFMLEEAAKRKFEQLLVVGHPGKLAKLIEGDWDTHSSNSGSAVPIVERVARGIGLHVSGQTVEGVFEALPQPERTVLGSELAQAVQLAIADRIGPRPTAMALVNMPGDILGSSGDLSPWL